MRFNPRILAAALAALGLVLGSAGAEPLKIRVGWVVAGSDQPLLILKHEGVARHEGQSYVLDDTHFAGTPPMITALAAGEVDLAPLAFSSFALAVQNAGMADLRVVADSFQDGVEGWYTNEYMVLKDSPIKSVEDLKGKVLVTNAAGSAVDMAMREMLAKHKLDDKKDAIIIESGFPNMKAMLAEGKVDLMIAVRPFSADPELRGMARTLFTQKDAIGRSQMIIWVAHGPYLQKNRAAVVDFLEDELRALHWFSDPANHEAAVKAVSDYTKIPATRFESWYMRNGDFYRDPNGMPDLQALQSNIDVQKQLGFLRADLDVRKYADLGYVEEAARRAKQQ